MIWWPALPSPALLAVASPAPVPSSPVRAAAGRAAGGENHFGSCGLSHEYMYSTATPTARCACSPALLHHTPHAPLTPSAAATSSQRAWRFRACAHAQPHPTRPHPPRSHAHCASCARSASLPTMPPRSCLVPVPLPAALEPCASLCHLTPLCARALPSAAPSIARCGRHLVLALRCLLLLLLLLLPPHHTPCPLLPCAATTTRAAPHPPARDPSTHT
jgi:hypothetical protein